MDYTGDQYAYDNHYHHPEGILRPRMSTSGLAGPYFPASCDRPGGFPVQRPQLRVGRIGDEKLPGVSMREDFIRGGIPPADTVRVTNQDLLFLVIILFLCMCFSSCMLYVEIKKLSAEIAAIQSKA